MQSTDVIFYKYYTINRYRKTQLQKVVCGGSSQCNFLVSLLTHLRKTLVAQQSHCHSIETCLLMLLLLPLLMPPVSSSPLLCLLISSSSSSSSSQPPWTTSSTMVIAIAVIVVFVVVVVISQNNFYSWSSTAFINDRIEHFHSLTTVQLAVVCKAYVASLYFIFLFSIVVPLILVDFRCFTCILSARFHSHWRSNIKRINVVFFFSLRP